MSYNVVEKLSAVGVFHDHVELFLRLNNFVQLNHIRVTYLLQNFNFSGNPLDVFLIMDLIFFEYFDSNFLTGKSVLSKFNLAECTFSKMFAYKIIIN